MLDDNLLLRAASAGNLTTTANLTGVDFGGPDLKPRTYMVNTPSVSGTSPTLDVKIQESDDNSTYRDFLAFPQITGATQIFVTGQSNARYRRAVVTLGGTTPNFGAAVIAPVPAGRDVNW